MKNQEIKDELDKIINSIKNDILPREIIMFGSYAYGNPNTNSDIDLCILIDRQDKRKIDIIKSIRSSIAKVASKPVDLVLYFNDEFHEKANITCTLESKIENEGVKLYEQ